ncbi:SGNH/GDSL hydrolase family protein [Butyrivibrio sp. MC2013]|uniref:SGNH/GDSL hydrolase family protein n=1 Tax=Butyrivibrio sp. MC2013 TaxID=1280686 RepID=UPI00040FE18F|nr:SGNH/GDSL hydrolase family protein [Butyrivibrio sp. MC2013]
MAEEMKMEDFPGNDSKYHLENVEALADSPYKGKRICFLGSSVTLGARSMDVSFADYISKRLGCSYVKEAVNGTTLADVDDESYISRMKRNISKDEKFDCFVCQLSTNDAARGLDIGKVSDSKDIDSFDTKTIAGAIEYIIAYAKETYHCPVVFYTGSFFESELYSQMIELIVAIRDKWGILLADLWHDDEMGELIRNDKESYDLYMADPVHPTQAGYLVWWLPKIEPVIKRALDQ